MEEEFRAWLDSVLSQDLPRGIAGFAVNLYEGRDTWDAELVGAPTFDAQDEDWACDSIFTSQRFEISNESVPAGWEGALQEVASWLKGYLQTHSTGATKLSSAAGIAIGFVDGNLILLKGSST